MAVEAPASGSLAGPVSGILRGVVGIVTDKDKFTSKELNALIAAGNRFIVATARKKQQEYGASFQLTEPSITELARLIDAQFPGALSVGEDMVSPQGVRFGDAETDRIIAGGLSLEELASRTGGALAQLTGGIQGLLQELGEPLDFSLTAVFPDSDLLDKLTDLLLNPTRVPGEPCLAPAPLLRDLLDMALGRITGGIGDTVVKVGESILDLLVPAFAEGEDLTHFIESVLADPITAALNLVLGKRDQIDCEVTAGLGVGERVMETQIKHLEEVLAGALA